MHDHNSECGRTYTCTHEILHFGHNFRENSDTIKLLFQGVPKYHTSIQILLPSIKDPPVNYTELSGTTKEHWIAT